MRALRYLNTVLTIIALLLTLQLWTSWTQGTAQGQLPDVATPAQAAIPNAAAQRKQMIDLIKQTNQNISDLTELFKSGKARVSMQAGK